MENNNYEKSSDVELVTRFTKDIQFNMHSIDAKIERSFAGKEIVNRGRAMFKTIEVELDRILRENTSPHFEELRMAWISLLFNITRKERIEFTPYSRNTRFGEQNLQDWISWCSTMS